MQNIKTNVNDSHRKNRKNRVQNIHKPQPIPIKYNQYHDNTNEKKINQENETLQLQLINEQLVLLKDIKNILNKTNSLRVNNKLSNEKLHNCYLQLHKYYNLKREITLNINKMKMQEKMKFVPLSERVPTLFDNKILINKNDTNYTIIVSTLTTSMNACVQQLEKKIE